MKEGPRFEGQPRREDPQKAETVNGVYSVARGWLRTGFSFAGKSGYRFEQFAEPDGTIISVGGYIEKEAELAATAEEKPPVEITFTPPKESDASREQYGIVVDETSGNLIMEKRIDRRDYPKGEAFAEEEELLRIDRLQEIDEKMNYDQRVRRHFGEAEMTEAETREIAERIARLTNENRIADM